MFKLLIFSSFFILINCALFNYYPKLKLSKALEDDISDIDPGEPLFLTPLIEAGKINEAQQAANVQIKEIPSVNSYSGYLTVNKQYNSSLFFWFFPALNNYETAPVLLWLQGGPGASSLIGLFTENGPLTVNKYKKKYRLKSRKYTWNLYHSVIYIDNPVGTGFSFTNYVNGFAQNENDVGENLYTALLQFFQLFPNLQQNPFFVTGESYGGKYVPAISYTIHKNNAAAKQKINLQGLAIGNGLSDPGNQLLYGDYLYQLGLIDDNGRDQFHQLEDKCRQLISHQDWIGAFELFDHLLNGDTINGSSTFKNITGFNFYFNYLHDTDYEDMIHWSEYIQTGEFRKMIHVGNNTYHVETSEVENHLKGDVMQSVAPWIEELLQNYRVLIYNGQLDIIVAYPLTVNYLKQLKYSQNNNYKSAKRMQWYVDTELAGYYKVVGNLTEVLVRNAGHMVPTDQPKWALDLITRFTANKPL